MRLTTLFWGLVAICVAAIITDYGLFAIATWALCCQVTVIQASIDYYFDKKKGARSMNLSQSTKQNLMVLLVCVMILTASSFGG